MNKKTTKMPNTKLIKKTTDSNFLSLMSLDSTLSASEVKSSASKSSQAKSNKVKSSQSSKAKSNKPKSSEKKTNMTKSSTKSTQAKKPNTTKTPTKASSKTAQNTRQIASKQKQIVSMFDNIAKDYDKANHLLSLGIDISWRIDACKRAYKALQSTPSKTPNKAESNAENKPASKIASKVASKAGQNPPSQNLKIADIACGTGDMLLQWHTQASKQNLIIDTLIGIDPSKEMLKIAKQKIQKKLQSSKSPKVLIKVSEAKNLSMLEKESVDILSISYGLRNVLEYERALSEFWRVLKPSGVLVVLDFFKKPNPSLLDRFVGIYTRTILPFVGWAISRNYEAYKYLPDSMDSFVSPQKLAQDLQSLGFKQVQIKGYSANISHLVLGVKGKL